MNPATNSSLRFATYTVGLNANDLTLEDASGSQKSTSTSLSYINIGFPVGKNAGVVFGLKPNTSVGYSLLNIVNDLNGDPLEATRFYGNGGTSKIYGTFGILVAKDLSLGVEGEYVFGKTENNILSQKTGNYLGTKNVESTKITGTGLKLGVHYKKELANKMMMNVGATIKLSNSLNTDGEDHLYSVSIESTTVEVPRDTLYSSSIKGAIKSPVKVGLGFGFGKTGKWFAGVDYEFQDALDIQGSLLTSSSTYSYEKSSRISIGGFYLPKASSISSYWNRVTYRTGVRFENTGLLVNSSGTSGRNFTKVKDFGISFGLGLPLKDLSNLNLGIEYGKKGSTINNLIQENYFNFKLSLSLNAFGRLAWFRKQRID